MANGQAQIIAATGDSSGFGKQIKIVHTTSGTADTIHTTSASMDPVLGTLPLYWDLITVRVYNSDTVKRTITFLWGGTTNPDDYMTFIIQPGVAPVTMELGMLTGGLVLKAFADAANVVMVQCTPYRAQQA